MKTLPCIFTLLGIFAVTSPLQLTGEEDKPDAPKKNSPNKESTSPEPPKGKKARPAQADPPQKPKKTPTPPSRPEKSEEKKNTRTWVGIMTAPVSQSLKEHLEIEDGFGIQIHDIADNSPAAKAGLRQHDIVLKFNDQMLISPDHLSLLVRRETPGTKANFTLIRVGKEETVSVSLGEAEDAPHDRRFSHPLNPAGRHSPPTVGREGGPQQWRERYDEWRNMKMSPPTKPDAPDSPVPPSSMSAESKPPAISVKPGFPVNIMGYHGVVKIDNDHGDVTITRKDDNHTIRIADAKGKLIFEGPYDPDKGSSSLPKEAKAQLEKMKLDDLKLLTPGKKPLPDAPPGQEKDKKDSKEKEGTPL